MNKRITNGLIAGIVYAILTFVVYLFGYKVFFGPAKVVPYFVVWGLLIYFAIQMRKEQGGYMTFKEGFVNLLVMYVVTEFVFTIFILLLYNVIDPDMSNTLKEMTISQMESTFSKLGMSGTEIDEAMTKLEEEDMTFTPLRALQSWLMWSVVGAIISSIVALIIKKDRPLFE